MIMLVCALLLSACGSDDKDSGNAKGTRSNPYQLGETFTFMTKGINNFDDDFEPVECTMIINKVYPFGEQSLTGVTEYGGVGAKGYQTVDISVTVTGEEDDAVEFFADFRGLTDTMQETAACALYYQNNLNDCDSVYTGGSYDLYADIIYDSTGDTLKYVIVRYCDNDDNHIEEIYVQVL